MAKSRKKLTQGLLLLLILIFPSLLYVILSTGKHDIARVEYYGPREAVQGSEFPDTIYYQVEPVSLEVQVGDSLMGLDQLDGNIRVLHFFCTSCYEANYRVLEQVGKVYSRFKDKPDVRIVSILIDSTDTEDSLEEAMRGYGMGSDKWFAVKLPKDMFMNFQREGLLMNEEQSGNLSTLVLLDKERHIRGYYDGKQYLEANRLIDAIKAIRFADFRPTKDRDGESSDQRR